MSLKTILFAGIAAVTLSSPFAVTSAVAGDDSYMCNDQRCYDDQAAETRRLNELQAEHPGQGLRAVPGYHGASYDDGDDDDDRNADDDNDDDYRGGYNDDHRGYPYGYDSPYDDRGYGNDDDDDDQPNAYDDDDSDDNDD